MVLVGSRPEFSSMSRGFSPNIGVREQNRERTGSKARGNMVSLFVCVGLTYFLSFSFLYSRYHDRLPLTKYLSNHALFLSPLNFVFTFFSRGAGRKPVFAPSIIPGLELVKKNYDL